MSCKGDWRGRSEAKDVVRERAWAALEASGDARDDDGPRGRIPDFAGAEEAYALARDAAVRAGRPLSSRVVKFFMIACGRHGQAERARTVYADHLASGGTASVPMLSAIMTALARRGHVDAVERTYMEARTSGLPPNIVLVNAILGACRHASDAPRALSLVETACGDGADGVRPDNVTLKLLLDTCKDGPHLHRAISIVNDAQRRGVTLDATTMSTLVHVCLNRGLTERAFEFYIGWSERSAGALADEATQKLLNRLVRRSYLTEAT